MVRILGDLVHTGMVVGKAARRKRGAAASRGHHPHPPCYSQPHYPPASELVGINWRLERPLVYLCWRDFPGYAARVQTLRVSFDHWDTLQEQAAGAGIMRHLRRWGYL